MFGDHDDPGDTGDVIECDEQSRQTIILKMDDVKTAFDLDSIDCKFSEEKVKPHLITYKQATFRRNVWRTIAKLAVNLVNDYEFFQNLIVKNCYPSRLNDVSMENLGYRKHENNNWISIEKPSQNKRNDAVYNYCFYSFIVTTKKKENLFRPQNAKENTNKNYYSPNRANNFPPNRANNFPQERRGDFYQKDNYRQNQKNPEQRNRNYNKNWHPKNQQDREEPIQQPPTDKTNANKELSSKAKELTAIQRDLTKTNINNLPEKKVSNKAEANLIEEKWICRICEKANPYSTQFCEVCDCEGPHVGKVRCSKCTYLNELGSNVCVVCLSQNLLDKP